MGILTSFIATGVAVLIFLGAGSGTNMIRNTFLWALEEHVNGQINIERVELGTEKHVMMYNVTLHLPDTLGGVEVVGIEEIWINFNGWSTLLGQASLYSVGINGLRIGYMKMLLVMVEIPWICFWAINRELPGNQIFLKKELLTFHLRCMICRSKMVQ